MTAACWVIKETPTMKHLESSQKLVREIIIMWKNCGKQSMSSSVNDVFWICDDLSITQKKKLCLLRHMGQET